MYQLTYHAPAKLNLFLHVNGQRSDGYHELQTLFQLIDWSDNLHFQWCAGKDIQVSTRYAAIPIDKNLVYRAAKLLQKHTQTNQGVIITLEKKLPLGGGVGGGSSDAATTLLVLNKLWGLYLSIEELAKLGASLGADVPIFIHGKTAFAQGIGEQLQPISLPLHWYLVVVPPCPVQTKHMFQHPELPRATPKLDWKSLVDSDFSALAWHNDFQALVLKQYPVIEKTFQELLKYGSPRLSGTGCCLFLTFPSKAEAQVVYTKLVHKYTCIVAKGINTSPMCAINEEILISSRQ